MIIFMAILTSGCDPKAKEELDAKNDALLADAYGDLLDKAAEDFNIAGTGEKPGADAFDGFDINGLGSVTYNYFSGKLPAWACCGYELYYIGQAGTGELSQIINERLGLNLDSGYNPLEWALRRNPAPFGDAWFIPGYLSENLSDDKEGGLAVITALHFTEYLDGLGLLPEVPQDDKETLESAWVEFIGGEQTPIDFTYRYHYGGNGLFSVSCDNIYCRFYDGGWVPSSVELYIGDANEKTLFMEEWFSAAAPKPVTYHFYREAGNEASEGADITLTGLITADRFTIAHKTAQYYAELCGFITGDTHYALAAGFAEYLAYESLPEIDREFLIQNAEILAYEELKNPQEPNIAIGRYKEYGEEYDTSEIGRLISAQSFARYVAGVYGKDGLLTVMPRLDDDFITEMTGKTYRDIIEEWTESLEERFG
jgi:hypothetical protein